MADDFKLDDEDDKLAQLQDEQRHVDSSKLGINLMGAVGDLFSNRQGFGNFYTGKMNPENHSALNFSKAAADSIQTPAERQAKLYAAVKAQREQDQAKLNNDATSTMSKAKKQLALRYGFNLPDDASGADVDQLMDAKKMNETEAESQVHLGNDMKKLEYSKNADLQKMREQEALRLKEKKEMMAEKRTEGMTEGRKAADKDYAKDYNDFTGGGEQKALDAIAKLKDFRKEMADDNGVVQAGGGTFSGSMPDWLRTQKSVARRDNIVTGANSSLKAIFGGQLSDGERKSAANEFYNDKLSNKENLPILDRKIAELENGLRVQKAKASHFQKIGSLTGFDGSGSTQIAGSGGGKKTIVQTLRNKKTGEIKQVYSDGSSEIIPATAGN